MFALAFQMFQQSSVGFVFGLPFRHAPTARLRVFEIQRDSDAELRPNAEAPYVDD